jgi:hypothetical protein
MRGEHQSDDLGLALTQQKEGKLGTERETVRGRCMSIR